MTKDDEAAAMAAMFQAQTQNWEETQEKMSQLVSPFAAFYLCSSSMSNEQYLFCPSMFCLLQLTAHLYQSTRYRIQSRRKAISTAHAAP